MADTRLVRGQITGRVHRSEAQRRTLAELGTTLSTQALDEVARL